jgi:signal transduction histidine kinase
MTLHVELLQEEVRRPSPHSAGVMAESLAEITTQLARLHGLVDNYLSLARVATIERTPQDLGAAVATWAPEWESLAATHQVTLQLEGLSRLGQAVFHANTLRRVLLNLVHNALEAMPHGGTLTLAGERLARQVQLHVRDTGSGIPAAQLPHIFEPFYTTKAEGTGLGLYIVREIMTAHAGQITVQSVEGQGTTFTVTLPPVWRPARVGVGQVYRGSCPCRLRINLPGSPVDRHRTKRPRKGRSHGFSEVL